MSSFFQLFMVFALLAAIQVNGSFFPSFGYDCGYGYGGYGGYGGGYSGYSGGYGGYSGYGGGYGYNGYYGK
uniref:Uncharacterized protein n=1 Tax=Caenorhabditis japonica TaxID=281687 RepID=A0A8R1EEF7_CAEJA